jgi:hypothetical protein
MKFTAPKGRQISHYFVPIDLTTGNFSNSGRVQKPRSKAIFVRFQPGANR